MWRTVDEYRHRNTIHSFGVTWYFATSIKEINHLPKMETHDVLDACNKSVPIYIPRHPHESLLRQVLHNYIYRRWFRPYRSEIGCERFICKFIIPDDLQDDETSPSQATVSTLVSLNDNICTQIKKKCALFEKQHALGETVEATRCRYYGPEFSILQPLFEALLVLVCSCDYHDEDSKTVGRLPVILVRTGKEGGLSAPITFEPIADKIDGYIGEGRRATKTTLETAVDFITSLEAREAAAFGLRPDPVAAWLLLMNTSSPIVKEIAGDELLRGPSSKFVNTEKYPEWTGQGEMWDYRMVSILERREFNRVKEARSFLQY